MNGTPEGLAALVRDIHEARPDAVLVGGDIGEADSFAGFLGRLAELLDVPLFFVLGNHDYYRGSMLGQLHGLLEVPRLSIRRRQC
jgi:3',5'-cyclic AMP phosphodiesterase CpdA